MTLLDTPETIDTMNRWGKIERPFLFVVSYEGDSNLVLPLDDIDPDYLRYDFAGHPPTTELADRRQRLSLPHPLQWQPRPPSTETYAAAFHHVKRHIEHGNSFLTNLTCHIPLDTNLTLEHIFQHTQAPYRLWWRGHFSCFSPETFLRIENGRIRSFPMKGTIDARLPNAAQQLLNNEKEAAEHATIVDLIRNDLSIVADEVSVARYRYIEKIDTINGPLLQTSSEIVGNLPANHRAHLGDILFAQLPAGSITGAPKPATQRIIAQAETHRRGFYTGVMGIFDGTQLDSAVMIRFVEQAPDGTLAFKAGGGITHRSRMEDEYAEMLQKTALPLATNTNTLPSTALS